MENSVVVLIGVAALAVIALVAFVLYGWRRRARIRRAETWVREFLAARYGGPLDHLSVSCCGDPLEPVLANFTDPRTGTRLHFRFACAGPPSTFALLSEREVER